VTLGTASGRTDVEVNFDQPHNRLNLLIAAAVADALDVRVPDRLSVEFSGLRGERIELADGMTVIDDCYNANPMSMRAALADLAEESVRRGGRSIAVLGDMLELGPYAAGMHAGIGQEAGAIGVDLLITVGPLAAGMAASFPGRSIVTDDAAGALQRLESELIANDTVLVKASRGIGLESIAAGLQEQI
jgi:UDP-N-acetylmuramoyl-tripeptide--D-alanyl-D-alanine ligase